MSGPNVLSSSEAQIHFLHAPAWQPWRWRLFHFSLWPSESFYVLPSGIWPIRRRLPKRSQRCFQCWYQATVEASLTSVSGTSGLRSFTTADTYFSWKGRMETAFFSIRISPFFHSSFLIAPDSICQRAGDTPTHTACNTVASQQNCKCTGGQHVAAGGKSHLTRRERRRIERETQRERRHSAICSLSTVSQMWFGT